MIERMLPLVALTGSYAALAVGAASGAVGGILVAATLVTLAEIGVAHRWDRIERTLTKLSFGFARRRFTADMLLIVAVVRAAGVSSSARGTVLVGVVAGALVAAGYLGLRRDDVDLPAVSWRNLTVDRPRWWRSRAQGFRWLSLPVLACVAALLVARLAPTGGPASGAGSAGASAGGSLGAALSGGVAPPSSSGESPRSSGS